jgi:hypothetical protein
MAMPSFSEYMKNKSDIITVHIFSMASQAGYEYFTDADKKNMVVLAKREALKQHCSIEVKNTSFIYEDMLGYKKRGVWGIFVTGSEKNILRMFEDKDISTKDTGSLITPIDRHNGRVFKGSIVKEWK